MNSRDIKNNLYELVARIGKAVSSPKRLELLELLSQGEKHVELLAREASVDMKLASAHLRALRAANLVLTRRDGKNIYYRLSGPDIAPLWVMLRSVAEEHLVELRVALDGMFAAPERLTPESRRSLWERARNGDVIVIDVRPEEEYRVGHLPFARSMPLHELEKRLAELPADKEIVAYCRGPFCLMSSEAATLLRQRGFSAQKIADGIPEWVAAGLPLETNTHS
jgi:rhodanese-related sulfurtransferase/DNA-binding transcriptional ArsR family regulator